jgi:hypothetical protein
MPMLSVCLIARNEAKNIERALRSVADLGAEIIVADTGSTDRTVEIARRWARVEHFAWVDDFSAAYNYCNAQAHGDWIFMLDADEELRAECRDELLKRLDDDRALAFTVLREDLLDLNRPDHCTEMLLTRLFRNRPDVHFVGHIHHQFASPLSEIALKTGLEVLHSEIRIRHYGYAGKSKREKLKRDAHLMELDLRDRPGQFYYLVELGRTYIALGDPRGELLLIEAAQMVRNGNAEALGGGGMLAALLEHVLACDKLPDGFPLSWTEASRLAIRLFPDSAPVLWQIARHEFRRNRFDSCRKLLEHVVALGREGAYNRLVGFDPSIIGDDARLNLGVCYSHLGLLDQAEQCFRQLLTSPTRAPAAQANLKQIRQMRSQRQTRAKRRSE